MNRYINALGARWSLMAESAFHEELKGEKEDGLAVERWAAMDEN
ncbi:MAG: DUF3782 domain-containing protein [Candidatus Caldarchaeum sp.]